MQLVKNYKQIHDSNHGFIKISNYACRIIDTMEFQRLRYLHQLGTCFFVFPCATHTRYEHSLGTYYLAGRFVDSLKTNSLQEQIVDPLKHIKELESHFAKTGVIDLDDHVRELIKIAGLCHDAGHGCFSHIMDDIFIPSVRHGKKNPLELHENRSAAILEYIIKRDDELKTVISDDDILFIKKLINPIPNEHGYIYQIISNHFNSIDVDKCDYLSRDIKTLGLKFGIDVDRIVDNPKVINNKVCYPKQMYHELADLFKTRYSLHKEIYCHKMVISTQMMINDLMILIDPIVNLYNSIFNIEAFVNITDNYILETVKFLYNNKNKFGDKKQDLINTAYELWMKLNKRQLYKFIGTVVSNKPLDFTFDYIHKMDDTIKENEIIIFKTKIGYVSGSKTNPLNDLYFYSYKDPNKEFTVKKEYMSYLIPDNYQEHLTMLFVKDCNNKELIDKMTVIYDLVNELSKT